MNMPGFAGEAALDKSDECYRATAEWAKGGDSAVMPQAPFPPGGPLQYKCTHGLCIPIVNCIDPIGCFVVAHKRQRCCYLGGIPLGCSWVAC